jgi:hypothetical protein
MLVRAEQCWLGSWIGPALFEVTGDSMTLAPGGGSPELTIPGTVFGGFVDSHVHLGLVDGTRLRAGGIAAVHDLGWIPDAARSWSSAPGLPRIRYAGAFLTAPGGYPADRTWAPRGSVVEVASPEQAAAAVAAQLAAGASFVKLTLNSAAGPVLDDGTLRALVGAAHTAGVEVVVHVEGVGQAARAFEAGADVLAHAPFSEALPRELLAAMAGRLRWVSTLAIHGDGATFGVARDNIRRFTALGGEVRYGTDLGNGPLPLGINEHELVALADSGVDLVAAIAPARSREFGPTFSWARGLPTDQHDLAGWLATASVISTADLEETFS